MLTSIPTWTSQLLDTEWENSQQETKNESLMRHKNPMFYLGEKMLKKKKNAFPNLFYSLYSTRLTSNDYQDQYLLLFIYDHSNMQENLHRILPSL